MLGSDFLKQNQRWFPMNLGVAVDLTTPAEYFIRPPAGFYAIAIALRSIVELDGTTGSKLTSAPVCNSGNDAAKINLVPAGATNVFGTLAQLNSSTVQRIQTSVGLNSLNPAIDNIVDTTTPFSFVIATGAVRNTATFFRARIWLFCNLLPLT